MKIGNKWADSCILQGEDLLAESPRFFLRLSLQPSLPPPPLTKWGFKMFKLELEYHYVIVML